MAKSTKPKASPDEQIIAEGIRARALANAVAKAMTEHAKQLGDALTPTLAEWFVEEAMKARKAGQSEFPTRYIVEDNDANGFATLKRQAAPKDGLAPDVVAKLMAHKIPVVHERASWTFNAKAATPEAMREVRRILDEHYVSTPDSTLPRDLLEPTKARTVMASGPAAMMALLLIKDQAAMQDLFACVADVQVSELTVSDASIMAYLGEQTIRKIMFPRAETPAEPASAVVAAAETAEDRASNIVALEAPAPREAAPAKTVTTAASAKSPVKAPKPAAKAAGKAKPVTRATVAIAVNAAKKRARRG